MVSCYATLLLAAASLLVVPSRQQEQHRQSCPPPSSDGGDDDDGEGRACVPPWGAAAGEKDDDDDDDDDEYEYAAAGIAVVVAEDDDDRRRQEEEPRFPDDFVHPCQDDDPMCPLWAREGECRFNSPYMLRACAGSCRTCQSPTTTGEEEEEEEGEGAAPAACVDKEKLCGTWADEDGECWINPDYMLSQCKYSCWECVDAKMDRKLGVDEAVIAKKLLYATTMNAGARQLVRPASDDGDGDGESDDPMTNKDADGVRATIRRMERYAKDVASDPGGGAFDDRARARCRNEFRMCAEWAHRGMCDLSGLPSTRTTTTMTTTTTTTTTTTRDDGAACHDVGIGSAGRDDVLFMMQMCPLACGTCHVLESLRRCSGRRRADAAPSFRAGELNPFMAASAGGAGGGWAAFGPLVVSRPNDSRLRGGEEEEEEGADDNDPYVIVFRDFLSPGEADHLHDVASAVLPNSTHDSGGGVRVRCRDDDRCNDDEIYQRIMRRIAILTNSSISHLEPMEVARVRRSSPPRRNADGDPPRHNFEVSSLWMPAGPRVLSLSLFLSNVGDDDDDHEIGRGGGRGGGGGVGFPRLDWLHVRPRRGIAVMWPNVKSDSLWEPEPLTSYDFFPLAMPNNIGADASDFVVTVHVRLHNWTDADMRGCA